MPHKDAFTRIEQFIPRLKLVIFEVAMLVFFLIGLYKLFQYELGR